MSDTTNYTSAIDEKKNQDSSTSSMSFISNIGGFLTSLIGVIILILLYFSSGGLILFICKLAQSNILPSDPNCAPYTNNQPNLEKIQTNIFTTFTDPEMSMKLEIPTDDKNTKYRIINIFKDYREKSDSNFLANYLISIVEALMQFDYSFISTTMNFLNGIPEAVIIGLGPIITSFLFAVGVLLNGLYFIYLWFVNMYWFFKTNTNVSGEGNPKWEDVTLMSPVNWCLGVGLVILFFMIFFVGFPLLSCVPFSILSYCVFSCLFYKGLLNGKNVSSLSIIKEVLKYYKVSIVSLTSLFIVLLSFSKLGVIPGIFSIITVLLIYFGLLGLNIFTPIPETHLSPSVSYDQARKTCITKNITKEKHGFLYNLLIGQKGGNITQELKKISRKLA
jgi:hypothetical protein